MTKPVVNDYLKDCIADAYILLLKEKPTGKITVDEIAARAGVGRVTCFRAFSSKEGIVTYKFIRMWEQYAELNDIRVRNRFDLDNALLFFEYNYSIKHILSIVYAAGMQEALHESFYRIMVPTDRDDPFTEYRERFYAHGLYGLLDGWILRDFRETPAEMADMIRKIVGAQERK